MTEGELRTRTLADRRTIRTIEFNALDPVTRQRFADATNGVRGPAQLISHPKSVPVPIIGWCLLALLGMAIVTVTLNVEIASFGDPRYFRRGAGDLLAYVVGLFLVAWGAIRAKRLATNVPFKRGRFVFPTDMVIATNTKLTIIPMERLLTLDSMGTDLDLHFDGYGHEYFTVRNEAPEQIADDVRFARERVNNALQSQDLQVLAALDVFFDARITEQWNDTVIAEHLAAKALLADSSGGPATYRTPDRPADPHKAGVLARPTDLFMRRAVLFAIAATLLAPPLWFARNYASDGAAFASAQRRNTTYAFQAYIAGDGSRSQECIDELLPEAAFSEARTVSALREFVQNHPGSARVEDARGAIHERFVQVRQDFLTQAASGDPTVPVFMGRLLDWLEAHDSPPVRVRFLAPSAEALSLIDQNLDVFGEVQGVTGGIAPVSPHFTQARSAPREQRITGVLQRGFAPIFPDDVMHLEHAGRIDEAQAAQPIVEPTFDITYLIRPSGSVYASARGFVGIHVAFHIQMRIPDSTETWGFDTSVEPPEHFTFTGADLTGDSAYRDGLVYSVIADRAFDQLGNQLALSFFRPDTNAYNQAQVASERDMRGDGRGPPGGGGYPGNLSPELQNALDRAPGDRGD